MLHSNIMSVQKYTSAETPLSFAGFDQREHFDSWEPLTVVFLGGSLTFGAQATIENVLSSDCFAESA